MTRRYLIQNGTVVLPDKKSEERLDILIEGQKIAAMGSQLRDDNAEVIDASGKHVLPGLIDMHVHLRVPGQEYKEDIASGTKAAAAGGVTSVACMPNTDPVVDSPELIYYLKKKITTDACVNVFPLGAISKGLEGKELAEMGLMASAGAVSFTDDGRYILNSAVMKNAILYARSLDITLISHCEDPFLAEEGEMNEGYYSTILGLKGIPAVGEVIAVARDILLAEKYGPLHIAHVSTRGAVNAIREAKKRGVPVTCETAPHYLWFTDENVCGYNTNFKMNPPLRSADDRAALIEGFFDGTIDVIATDHAPHATDEKLGEFRKAAFGVIGVQTALSACFTKLCREHDMPLWQLVRLMTVNPADILKLDRGVVAKGAVADLAIIDTSVSQMITEDTLLSKSKNSPFLGIELTGKVVYTFVNGRIVYTG